MSQSLTVEKDVCLTLIILVCAKCLVELRLGEFRRPTIDDSSGIVVEKGNLVWFDAAYSIVLDEEIVDDVG